MVGTTQGNVLVFDLRSGSTSPSQVVVAHDGEAVSAISVQRQGKAKKRAGGEAGRTSAAASAPSGRPAQGGLGASMAAPIRAERLINPTPSDVTGRVASSRPVPASPPRTGGGGGGGFDLFSPLKATGGGSVDGGSSFVGADPVDRSHETAVPRYGMVNDLHREARAKVEEALQHFSPLRGGVNGGGGLRGRAVVSGDGGGLGGGLFSPLRESEFAASTMTAGDLTGPPTGRDYSARANLADSMRMADEPTPPPGNLGAAGSRASHMDVQPGDPRRSLRSTGEPGRSSLASLRSSAGAGRTAEEYAAAATAAANAAVVSSGFMPARAGESGGSGGGGGASVGNLQAQVVQSVLDASLDNFREVIHRDIQNLHLEMLRQFQIQQASGGHLLAFLGV